MTTFETADVNRGIFLYSIGAQVIGVRFCRGAARFVFHGDDLAQWNTAYEQGDVQGRQQYALYWSPLFCERICEHLGLIDPIADETGGEGHAHD